MIRVVTSIALAVTTVFSALAQDAPEPGNSRKTSAIIGATMRDAEGGTTLSASCILTNAKKLPPLIAVVVLGKKTCSPQYGQPEEFYEVLINGKARLIRPQYLYTPDDAEESINARSQRDVEQNKEVWRTVSELLYQDSFNTAYKALKATAKSGIALIKSEIFDTSEHTEGTGFKFKIYNSGKKTIKYVTFNVIGLNAVKDAVRAGYTNSTIATLRGIGPIEHGEAVTYSKDYMWMTDIVQHVRIQSIKLEYTDGSSKTITDMKTVKVKPEDYAILMMDID